MNTNQRYPIHSFLQTIFDPVSTTLYEVSLCRGLLKLYINFLKIEFLRKFREKLLFRPRIRLQLLYADVQHPDFPFTPFVLCNWLSDRCLLNSSPPLCLSGEPILYLKNIRALKPIVKESVPKVNNN